jgi:phosphoglycolate phosphatase-like HAD superfamily hydrolase
MYKLWMFDFDNTIARLEPEVDWAGGRLQLEPFLRSVGAPADIFERIPRGNLPLYDAYRKLLVADGIGASENQNLRSASAMIEKIELAGVDRAKPLEGALELLAAIRDRGAQIAIVTSNSSRTINRWFQLNPLSSVRHPSSVEALSEGERGRLPESKDLSARVDLPAGIAAIVGRDTMLALKPAPDMVIRALEQLSATPEDAAFVGDSEADFLAARAAHVRFYGIAHDDKIRDRLLACGADEIYSSPAALAIHLNLLPPQ